MHTAILTFDGYNELDSLIALGILNRVPGARVSIASPTPRVTRRPSAPSSSRYQGRLSSSVTRTAVR